MQEPEASAARERPAPAWHGDPRAAWTRVDEPDVGDDELRAIHDRFAPDARAGDPGASYAAYRAAKTLAERHAAQGRRAEELDALRDGWAAWTAARRPSEGLRFGLHVGDRLRRSGLDEEARVVFAALADDLEPGHEHRIYALEPLVDIDQRARRWQEALERIASIEREYVEIRGGLPDDKRCVLANLRAGTWIAMGLPDLAAPLIRETLPALERLHAEGVAVVGPLLNCVQMQINLHLASDRYEAVVREVEDALERHAAILERRPGVRGALLVRLGTAHAYLSQRRSEGAAGRGAEHAREARTCLLRALDDPGTSTLDRLTAEGRLAALALDDGRHDDAARRIEAARERIAGATGSDGAELPTIDVAVVECLGARLLRERGAEPGELRDALERTRTLLAELSDEWRRHPPRPGGVGYLRYARNQLVIGEVLTLTRRLDPTPDGARAALEVLIDAQGTGSLARTLGDGHATLDEVRALAPEDGGLLVYFPSHDATHLFVLEARGPALHLELAGRAEFDELVDELRPLVATSPRALRDDDARARRTRRLDELARALGRTLLPPDVVERASAWRAASVVGADLIGAELFEALPWEGPDARREGTGGHGTLGTEVALAYLSSLPLGAALLAREAPHDASAPALQLVHGAELSPEVRDAYPHLEPLPRGGRDLERMASAYAPARVEELAGPDATLTRLREAQATPARVLHVLTHGVLDRARERPAGLVLSGYDARPDGLLWCEDVEELAGCSPVVVLTACGSAAGPERRGDGGASHLGGAFLRRGAEVVVLSGDDLALGATLALMRVFHTELARGASPAEALRLARCALTTEEDGAFRDPFYRDLVHATGLGHRAPFPRRPSHAGSTAERAGDAPRAPLRLLGLAALLLLGGAAALVAVRAARAGRARAGRSA